MKLPDPIKLTRPVSGYPVYEIDHPKATARVALHGAHVLEWTPANQKPVLYLSPQAVFEEGKAVRGGIPICWPWFGPALEDKTLPMHGFVRNRFWTLTEATSDDDGVKLAFGISDDEATRKLWPESFHLRLEVSIGATLRLELSMQNKGADTVFITNALHTYLTVGDVSQIKITGLGGAEYLDRVGPPVVRQQFGEVVIDQEVDRDYDSHGAVVLHDPVLKRAIHIKGENHGNSVVWNPWIEKSKTLGDLPDEAFHGFVCIETANAWRDELLLPPGGVHALAVTLECVAER